MLKRPLGTYWSMGRVMGLIASFLVLLSAAVWGLSPLAAPLQENTELEIVIDASRPLDPIDLTRYSLGQGGLSPDSMFDAHVEQLQQLHPKTIRLFVQEYYDLYPAQGTYHWDTLDRTIEAILATGAKPILSICFKPKVLYPKVDDRIVHPTSYEQWEELIYRLVKHCNDEKGYGIEYWEVGNEVDIGENGGTPYEFENPVDYTTYYSHTVKAVLRADPDAKVGGPALANYASPIGDALIEFCGSGKAPLHFLSWHRYDNDPGFFRRTIREMKAKLARYPSLQDVETIIDEWNMSLGRPNLNPSFQPAFILENTWGFHHEGLSRAAYYHIRDYFVDPQEFAPILSPDGIVFMAHWWNTMPQYDGLWDNQGRVRPAYYAFKLMSLIRGSELKVDGGNEEVKGFAAVDEPYTHVLLWNFPPEGTGQSYQVTVRFPGSLQGRYRVVRLNPETHVNNLEVIRFGNVRDLENQPVQVTLDPYEIRWIEILP